MHAAIAVGHSTSTSGRDYSAEFVCVDDLITDSAGQGRGWGERLLAELRTPGREEDCGELVLDAALCDALAQRFSYRAELLAVASSSASI